MEFFLKTFESAPVSQSSVVKVMSWDNEGSARSEDIEAAITRAGK